MLSTTSCLRSTLDLTESPSLSGLGSGMGNKAWWSSRRLRALAGPSLDLSHVVGLRDRALLGTLAFTGRLREAGIRISMDGRGRCLDNIFIERLWRSLKYEAVYLRELADGFEARRVIGE